MKNPFADVELAPAPAPARIDLCQDNGGQLCAIARDATGARIWGYAGFEFVEGPGTALADAHAMLGDNTGEWTLDRFLQVDAVEIAEACEHFAPCPRMRPASSNSTPRLASPRGDGLASSTQSMPMI